uniref:THAP-type domain-containing protein n=1 Tax=Photinus pyralis TaxID=7054 RepID=A0A1Y1KAD0_PHOPY
MKMVCCCFYKKCGSRSGQMKEGVSFHRFPKDEQMRIRWLKNMKQKFTPTANSRLCSLHFEKKWYLQHTSKPLLLAQAVPTIFSFSSEISEEISQPSASHQSSESEPPSVLSQVKLEATKLTQECTPVPTFIEKSWTEKDKSKEILQKKLEQKTERLRKASSTIKILRQKVRRYEKKINNLSFIVKELRQKKNDGSSPCEFAEFIIIEG